MKINTFYKNSSIFLVSCFFAIYLCEGFLYFVELDKYQKFFDKDKQSIKENFVNNKINVLEFNEKETFYENIYIKKNKGGVLSMSPSFYLNQNYLSHNDINLFPLSSISLRNTLYCNENEYWSEYKSDRYGFANKDIKYEKTIKVGLIGDSFVEGACVNENETFAANFDKIFANTISFGKQGTGPLIQYAIYKEYVKKIKPKIILWFYYKNDLENLTNELQNKTLSKYLLKDDFSQNLILKQNEIDCLLTDFIIQKKDLPIIDVQNKCKKFNLQFNQKNKKQKKESNNKNNIVKFFTNNKKFVLINFIKLFNVRSLLGLKKPTNEMKVFKEILLKVEKDSKEWGGKLFFIYLPDLYRYQYTSEYNEKNFIDYINYQTKINTIDIDKLFLSKVSNPLSYFSLYKYTAKSLINKDLDHLKDQIFMGHYNKLGYQEISKVIIDEINNRLNN